MKNLKASLKKYGLPALLGWHKDFENVHISEGDSPELREKLNKQRRKNEK